MVAAAQQITARPRVAMGEALRHTAVASMIHPTTSASLNFTKEFAQQYTGTGSLSHLKPHRPIDNLGCLQPSTSQIGAVVQPQHPQQYEPALNHMLRDRVHLTSNYHLHHPYNTQQQPSNSQQQQQKPTAGEQLETKYRNDIISTTQKATTSSSQGQAIAADKAADATMTTTNETRSDLANETQRQSDRVDDVEFWQTLSQKYIGPTTFDFSAKDAYIFDEAANPLIEEIEDPFSEAMKRLQEGDIPSAALLFEVTVQKDSQNALAWRYLGTTQAQNEKDVSAIRALRTCLELDPSDQKARLAIAVSLANELQRNESCKHLLEWMIRHDTYKTLNASVEHFDQLVNEGHAATYGEDSLHQKRYDYVRDKFVEAARLRPTDPDPDVQNSLGVLFNMRGEYSKAVDCFKAALSVSTDDSLLWNRLGATLANGNKSDEAIAAYRKALELAPGFLRTRYNLAISLIHLNSFDEAAKQLVQILNMQAAGKGSKNVQIRTRSITSTSIWNTLRTVATLSNKPDLYPVIDGRDLSRCNELIMGSSSSPPGFDEPIRPTASTSGGVDGSN